VRLPQGHGLGAQHFGCGEALVPAEQLSRGQQKWLLSNSYSGLGLSDSHGYKQQRIEPRLNGIDHRTPFHGLALSAEPLRPVSIAEG
jgi:hypothetical protein